MQQVNSGEHRLWSSSATFQKGLYHLFLLSRGADPDAYARGLRTYQVLFFLVETGFLLNFETKIPKPKNREPAPDPAGDLEHTTLRHRGGFSREHPMAIVSRRSVDLLEKVWDARNNMIYRPHMQLQDNGHIHGFFEDCTLQDLLSDVPTSSEVENLYAQFLEAIGQWNVDGNERAGRFLGSCCQDTKIPVVVFRQLRCLEDTR